MVTNRLLYFLESTGFIVSYQKKLLLIKVWFLCFWILKRCMIQRGRKEVNWSMSHSLEVTRLLRERLWLWFVMLGWDLCYIVVMGFLVQPPNLLSVNWTEFRLRPSICSGSFKTTPVPALLIEMGKMLLKVRRNKFYSIGSSFMAQSQDMFHSAF